MSHLLRNEEKLGLGDSIESENGAFSLCLEADGNLVLRDFNQDTVWNSETQRQGVDRACMQGDGNFVLYSGGKAVWSTDTWKTGGDRLVLQNDRNLVLYKGGEAVWSSGTYLGWLPEKSWMYRIADKKRLSAISIPGTHDTCSLHGIPKITDIPVLKELTDAEMWVRAILGGSMVICQKMSLSYQLLSGIRMIDIRCRHIENTFAIHHGAVFQHQYFGTDVRDVLYRFLRIYKHETVVMMLKEEHTAEANTRSFEDTFRDYIKGSEDMWYLGEGTPTLAEARGKIVLMRRYEGQLGIPANDGWSDGGCAFTINDVQVPETTPNKLRVQDCYEVKNSDTGYESKWTKIKNLLYEAAKGNPDVWYINFSSGTTGISWEELVNNPEKTLAEAKTCPEIVASKMNPKLLHRLERDEKSRIGSIMLDFLDYRLTNAIIDMNELE